MKIYFGCGKHKVEGFIGVDKLVLPSVDIVHDMNIFPYPFSDNSVDEVLLFNIIEHLPDTVRVMEEIWRICKNAGIIKISVPYYNSPGAFQDPTHLTFFTEHTFDYFTQDGKTSLSHYNYYSRARFHIISVVPFQRQILNFLPKRIQWFLAHHFVTVHSLEFTLKTIK